MRMAMSCLAFPETGRPTLRARRSSAVVDSGMSEKSSLLSGVGLAFFAGRLARADDANDFLGIFHSPRRVYQKKKERFHPANTAGWSRGLASAGRPHRRSDAARKKSPCYVRNDGVGLGLAARIVPVEASGSPKTVAASSNDTPCFFRLLRAFLASQENTLVYIR
jgi:hypothetical protein